MPGDNRPPAEVGEEPAVLLPPMPLGEAILEDYRVLRLSLKAHPLSLLRPRLTAQGIVPASALATGPAMRKSHEPGVQLIPLPAQ